MFAALLNQENSDQSFNDFLSLLLLKAQEEEDSHLQQLESKDHLVMASNFHLSNKYMTIGEGTFVNATGPAALRQCVDPMTQRKQVTRLLKKSDMNILVMSDSGIWMMSSSVRQMFMISPNAGALLITNNKEIATKITEEFGFDVYTGKFRTVVKFETRTLESNVIARIG